MKKRYSINQLISYIFTITVSLILLIFILFSVISIRSYTKQVLQNSRTMLNHFSDNMLLDFSDIVENNSNVVYSDSYIRLLSLDQITIAKQIESNYALYQILPAATPSYGITALYDAIHDKTYYSCGSQMEGTTNFLIYNAFIHEMEKKLDHDIRTSLWQLYETDSNHFILYPASRNNLYLTSIVDLDRYLATKTLPVYTESGEIFLYSKDGAVVNSGFFEKTDLTPDRLMQDSKDQTTTFTSGYVLQNVYLDYLGIGIGVAIPVRDLITYIFPQILMGLGLTALIIVITYIFRRLLSRAVLFPVKEIANLSRQMENDTEPEEETDAFAERIEEFSAIRSGLYDLMEKKTALEVEKANKEKALEQAVLQYYQLQTRSHFFLNCLKSLFNMAENGESKKIQTMIIAFSNHLRYIFHDNLSTVTLEAELKEVQDYHRIILLDYTRVFLLTQDVPKDLLSLEVPPLIVQTFLENTYKYNYKTGEPLLFKISAARVTLEEKSYVKLTLSDNGNGYDPEVLKKINDPITDGYDRYNVGINNLRRRLDILYHNEAQTMFYNSPGKGAVSVIYIPVEEDKNS